MKYKFIKYIILSLCLTLIGNYVEARKVTGFIITENSDTIYGKIKVSSFNLLTAGLVLDGINLEPLYYEVWFKSYEDKKFIDFKAKDISGFGFRYKSRNYAFRSFILESNTFFKSERKRDRFLQLCYKGKVNLYKDLSRIINHNNTINYTCKANYHQSFVSYDYFLFNDIEGLTKVELTDDIKTIDNLLNLYDFEKEFIEIIPKKTKLRDIKGILKLYEFWLYEIESKKIYI